MGCFRYLLGVIAAGLIAAIAYSLPTDAATKARVAANYGKLPLIFEANRGQTDARVKFLSRGPGYTLFLTESEAVLSLRGTDGKGHALRVKLLDAKAEPKMTGLARLPGVSNYFIGRDRSKWQTGVPHFAKVGYEGVYPGIDLVFYGTPQRRLEYDFVVAPGADPAAITIEFAGAEALEIDTNGDLILRVTGGVVRQIKPLVYQEIDGARQAIAGAYVSRGERRIGFEIASYDSDRALVIDPVLVFSTYLGGTARDEGQAIAVDGDGDAYVTGLTLSTAFPTAGPLQAANAGDRDAFVTKLGADGSTLVYSTYLGGSGRDEARGIAVDGGGNAYVTGITGSTDFPTASPLQAANAGFFDIFVTKLDPAGAALVYSTYLGGGGNDFVAAIAIGGDGSAYVTGQTGSTDYPTVNPFQASNAGGFDATVSKLNPAGTALVYSTYLGGGGPGFLTRFDAARGIAVDGAGNAYVTGFAGSAAFPTVNAFQAAKAGGDFDAFVTKIDPAGDALVYSTYLGGGGTDIGSDIVVDDDGNAYVTGRTESTDFPTASPLQAANAGDFDTFVTKIDPAGTALIYSTYLGGGGTELGLGIAIDGGRRAYLTGSTESTDFPTEDAFQAANAGGLDAYVTTINAAGTGLFYSTYLGGGADDLGRGIAVDGGDNAYVAGQSASADFPTETPLQAVNAGGDSDAFVAIFAADPVELLTALVDTVVALNLQMGISNSLDAKLGAVVNALDDVNANNDGAAINALEAFINAIMAQSGDKISEADAAALIAAAEQIIALLSGG